MNLLDRLNARMAIYNESIIQPLINPECEKSLRETNRPWICGLSSPRKQGISHLRGGKVWSSLKSILSTIQERKLSATKFNYMLSKTQKYYRAE